MENVLNSAQMEHLPFLQTILVLVNVQMDCMEKLIIILAMRIALLLMVNLQIHKSIYVLIPVRITHHLTLLLISIAELVLLHVQLINIQ